MTPSSDAAKLGEPSYVWRSGQERRLDLIRSYVPLEEQRVLDVGCGVGTYVRRLRGFSSQVYGIDISFRRLMDGSKTVDGLLAAVGEFLPFRTASFDMVLLNEVIEHVQDDRRTLVESVRILRPGGHLIIFAPNRLYPFETHGMQLGRHYVFGNVPFINYLPDCIRNRLVPHARAYRAAELGQLTGNLGLRLVTHEYVYPGFDNIATRSGVIARLLRSVLYRAEHTRLRRYGLSHFLILQRVSG